MKPPKDAKRELRYDFGGIVGEVTKTPQGFLRIPATLGQVGVLDYFDKDGNKTSEYRPEEEVFAPMSLQSAAGAPVTHLHPSEAVSPANVTAFQQGFVAERDVRRDGDQMVGEVIAQARTLIKAVERKDAVEISPGYTCWIEQKSGTYKGKKYDQIQRGIIHNHFAIGPSGWGRNGADVSLHMDSGDAPEGLRVAYRTNEDFEPPAGFREDTKKETATMELTTIKVDGIDFEVAQTAAVELQKAIVSRDTRIDEMKSTVADAKAAVSKLEAERDEIKTRLDSHEEVVLADLVRARVELEGSARKFVEDSTDFSEMTDRQIKEAVLATRNDGIDFSKKDDQYIDNRYEFVIEGAAEKREDDVWSDVRDSVKGRSPRGRKSSAQKAQEEMIARKREMARKPLTIGISKS